MQSTILSIQSAPMGKEIRLSGSRSPGGEHRLIAVIDVSSDNAERPAEGQIVRKILGVVRKRGPFWDDYMRTWRDRSLWPFEEDGRTYVYAEDVAIDGRSYSGFAGGIHVDGDRIGVIVPEHFTGTLDEYYAEVERSNQVFRKVISRVDKPQPTLNDWRALQADEPLPPPQGHVPLAGDLLKQYRRMADRAIDRRLIHV